MTLAPGRKNKDFQKSLGRFYKDCRNKVIENNKMRLFYLFVFENLFVLKMIKWQLVWYKHCRQC